MTSGETPKDSHLDSKRSTSVAKNENQFPLDPLLHFIVALIHKLISFSLMFCQCEANTTKKKLKTNKWACQHLPNVHIYEMRHICSILNNTSKSKITAEKFAHKNWQHENKCRIIKNESLNFLTMPHSNTSCEFATKSGKHFFSFL